MNVYDTLLGCIGLTIVAAAVGAIAIGPLAATTSGLAGVVLIGAAFKTIADDMDGGNDQLVGDV